MGEHPPRGTAPPVRDGAARDRTAAHGGGDYQAAVTAFRRATEHEPLNESAHRELMTCWSQLGETARAVRHYAELTKLLADQICVHPAAETTALYQRLLGQS